LGGTLRYLLAWQAAVSQSYDSYASSGLVISLSPGVRGKYGDIKNKQETAAS